jgi:hypothetical protein
MDDHIHFSRSNMDCIRTKINMADILQRLKQTKYQKHKSGIFVGMKKIFKPLFTLGVLFYFGLYFSVLE